MSFVRRPIRILAPVLAIAVIAVATLGVPGSTVGASTFPGENGLLVFAETHAGENFPSDIITMWPDGTHRQNLTDDDLINSSPGWSPDGTRIVFASWGRQDQDGMVQPKEQIYVMNVDGSEITRVSADPDVTYFDPSFSASRDKVLAVKSATATELERVVEIDIATSAETWLIQGAYFSEPTAASDGSAISFREQSDMSADDNLRILGHKAAFGIPRAYAPCWMPDGSALLYSSRSPNASGDNVLWAIGADGSNAHVVTDSLREACPSPDGKMLVGLTHGGAVVVTNADGSGAVTLPTQGSTPRRPEWQPTDMALIPPTTTTTSTESTDPPPTTAEVAAVSTTPKYAG